MTEEEFIKDYFRNKKILNEDAINAAIDLTTGFLSQGDPLTRLAIEAIKYGIIKTTSDITAKYKDLDSFLRHIFEMSSKNPKKMVQATKPKSKAESKARNEKLKIRGMIRNSGVLYLKYFLIVFTLNYFEEASKPRLNSTLSNEIFTDLQLNQYRCPITGERFDESNIIMNRVMIKNELINQENFYLMLEELFITGGGSKGSSLYGIINAVLQSTTTIDSKDIDLIFQKFYSLESPQYKVARKTK
jgi:hypothetical protein